MTLALKGDVPGHEFHGNQWTGGGEGSSSSGTTLSRLKGDETEVNGMPAVTLTEDATLYHATSNAQRVLRAGLKPSLPPEVEEDPDASDEDKESLRGVYLTDRASAEAYLAGRLGGRGTVLAVGVPAGTTLIQDPVDPTAVFLQGRVPAYAIYDETKHIDWRLVLTAVKFLNRLGVKTLAYYEGALHGLVSDLIGGAITQDQFLSFGYQLIEDQVTEAWFEGIGRNGFDMENMTSDWWDHLNGMIAREQDYFSGFADDIAGLGEQEGLNAALSRADLYAQRYIDVENQAWLYSSAAVDTFVWVMGDTEEHCPECAALDGWVATSQEWQESGINPQMPPNDVLTCGGWRCDCRLEKTDAPSMGSPRDALEAVKHLKGDVPGHEFHGNQWTGSSGGSSTYRGTVGVITGSEDGGYAYRNNNFDPDDPDVIAAQAKVKELLDAHDPAITSHLRGVNVVMDKKGWEAICRDNGLDPDKTAGFFHKDYSEITIMGKERFGGQSQANIFNHEIGHLAWQNARGQGRSQWSKTYRTDAKFDRHTSYSMSGGYEEAFCETYAAFTARGGAGWRSFDMVRDVLSDVSAKEG